MIKSIALIYRNPALSPEEFQAYWENTHVPMVRAALPGLCHYCGSFPLPGAGRGPYGDALDCDAVIELGWPDKATMKRDMTSPEFNTPEREASSGHLMDLARTRTITVEQVTVDLG
jgi:uncharacterized protein (TIGR02118 family)